VSTAKTRIARIAGPLAAVAVALTAATAANAQLVPSTGLTPVTQDGPTLSIVKSGPPCTCLPLAQR
jgi:hypothetical protein